MAQPSRGELAALPSRDDPVTVLCPECGQTVEVHDVAALLLALHLTNACARSLLIVQE